MINTKAFAAFWYWFVPYVDNDIDLSDWRNHAVYRRRRAGSWIFRAMIRAVPTCTLWMWTPGTLIWEFRPYRRWWVYLSCDEVVTGILPETA